MEIEKIYNYLFSHCKRAFEKIDNIIYWKSISLSFFVKKNKKSNQVIYNVRLSCFQLHMFYVNQLLSTKSSQLQNSNILTGDQN